MQENKTNLAEPEEILGFLTRVLRGDVNAGSGAPMKAAELLGKRFGLFGEQPEEGRTPIIVDDIAKCAEE